MMNLPEGCSPAQVMIMKHCIELVQKNRSDHSSYSDAFEGVFDSFIPLFYLLNPFVDHTSESQCQQFWSSEKLHTIIALIVSLKGYPHYS